MFCKEGFLSEVLDREVQGMREGLDEGTTSGRAGFVQLYGIDGAILNTHEFHILTTDIHDGIHLGIEEGSSIVMCYRFNFTFFKLKCGLEESFTVTGGAGMYDLGIGRKLIIDLSKRLDGCL